MKDEQIDKLNKQYPYNQYKTRVALGILMMFIAIFSLPLILHVGNFLFVLGLIISVGLFLSIGWHWFKHQGIKEECDKITLNKIATSDKDSFDKQIKWNREYPLDTLNTQKSFNKQAIDKGVKILLPDNKIEDMSLSNLNLDNAKMEQTNDGTFQWKIPIKKDSGIANVVQSVLESKQNEAKGKDTNNLLVIEDTEHKFQCDLIELIKNHPDEVKDFIKKNKKKK